MLEVRHVSQPGIVRDISFTLHRGEVLGLSGLMGAGRTELARILFGLDPHASGSIALAGEPLRRSARRRVQQGLALLTESRRDDGLCLEASVADNIALVTLPQRARSPLRLLDFAGLRVKKYKDEVDHTLPAPIQKVLDYRTDTVEKYTDRTKNILKRIILFEKF